MKPPRAHTGSCSANGSAYGKQYLILSARLFAAVLWHLLKFQTMKMPKPVPPSRN